MNDFVRGGQLAIHSVRMNVQVWKWIIRLILLIFLVSCAQVFYTKTSPMDWKNLKGYIKRELALNDEAEVTYYTKYGIQKTQKNRFAKHNPIFKELEKNFESLFYEGLILASYISATLLVFIILYFRFSGKKKAISLELRGVFLASFKQVLKGVKKHNSKFDYKPISIVGMPYPITGSPENYTSGEQSHTMIVGSTGSGKTSIIRELIMDIHNRGDKAIIVDVKGDYTKYCYRNELDVVLNPLDQRGANWSIFNETDTLTGFATIAKSLIPADSKDPIWSEAARVVFSEMATLYADENLSMSEFADKLLKPDVHELMQILKNTYAQKIINTTIDKAALSVLMTLSTYLRPLKLYKDSKDCFSIRNWILNNTWNKKLKQNGFLILSSKAEAKRDLNPLLTAQMDIAINAMRSMNEESNKPKIWFILDELGYFDQQIPNLIDGLTTARSYGGCFVLGIQDITTLAKVYSREQAETITNNCKTKLFMNVEGAQTARWCSDNIGQGEVEEWNESFSYGAHEMRDGMSASKIKRVKNAVLEGEFSLLKTGQGYIKLSGYRPSKFSAGKRPILPISERYIENTKLSALLEQEKKEQANYRRETEKKLIQSSNCIQEQNNYQENSLTDHEPKRDQKYNKDSSIII